MGGGIVKVYVMRIVSTIVSGKQRKNEMKKSIKSELNRYLKELSRVGLENEIKKLYSKFGEVKKYYELELSQDASKVLNEFKDRIKKEYFPSRGYGRASNKESKKVITEFKNISIFQKDVIELILYRVETMIEFTKTYGDIDEPFYNSLESSFNEACKLIKDEKLEKEYRGECRRLMAETYYFGWGLYDGFKYSYDNNFVD